MKFDDEYSKLLDQRHSIWNSWKNYSCHLLNVHGIDDVRQTEMCTAKPLIPEPSSEVAIAIEKLK
jgi:hypothetical protein